MSWVHRTRRVRRHERDDRTVTPTDEPGPVDEPRLVASLPVPELDLHQFESDSGSYTDGIGSHGNATFRHVGATGPYGDGSVDARSMRTVSRQGVQNGHVHPELPRVTQPLLQVHAIQEADVVAVVSAEARFVFVSASAERLLGHDVRNAVGKDAFALFDSESVPGVRALFDDLVARRRLFISMEVQAIRPDGRVAQLELTAANQLDEPIGGIVVALRNITRRKQLEHKANELDRRHNALIESLVEGLVIVDVQGRVVRVNESFEVMFRAPRIRILGHTLEHLIEGSLRRGVEIIDESGEMLDPRDHPVLASLRRGRRVDGSVIGFKLGDMSARWMRVSAQPIVDCDGEVTGAVGTFDEITDARHAAYALRQEEEFLRVLLDTLDEGIVACDSQGRMTIFNRAARRMHGLNDLVEPIGRVPVSRMLRHLDGTPIEPEENPLILAMSGERLRDVEIILAPADGEPRKVSVNGQALVDENGWKLGAVVAIHDVTEQKRNEARLADLAHHDPLTGLANRTLLAQRMSEAVDGLGGRTGEPGRWPLGGLPTGGSPDDGARTQPEHPGVAVYLLDLDNFKEVNDDFGHDVGDDLLVAVAGRLTALVRPSDTVARLGGDEFVVVCEIESGEEEMLRISSRIAEALAVPYRIDGRTLIAEASVGGVFVDDPDTDPSKLLSLADDAMYGVKWSRRRDRRSMAD